MKRSLTSWAWALLLSTPAFAQTVSDVMPAPEPAPAGSSRMYLPGMPLPPNPSGNRAAPAAAPEGTKKGLNLGYDDTFTGATDFSRDDAELAIVDRSAETHVVKKGDTLWSIAGSYLGSPWQWPKLWALNPSITNPHWIFPGDVLRLRAAEAVATPTPTAPTQTEPKIVPRPQSVTGLFLRQTGFVEPKELEASGKIIASKEEKVMLASDDEAYVEYKKGNAPKVGERLSIYRPDRALKHPQTGKKIGYVVEIFSDAEVLSVSEGKLAKIKLRDAMEPSERGFRVGPLRRQFKIIESKKDTQNIEAVVADTLRASTGLVGADMLVFLDRGRKSGLEIGNRLLITRRGDGYLPVLSKGPVDDKRYPRETIGEIVVIDVREDLSTAVVTKSIKEARVGDRVEARSGL